MWGGRNRRAYDRRMMICGWLGMEWDAYEGTTEVVQSERLGMYREMLQRLWEKGVIYPCTCSRAKVAEAVAGVASARMKGRLPVGGNVRYPGICRVAAERFLGLKGIEEVERAIVSETGKQACWRLRVEEGVISFDDVIAGNQRVDVSKDAGDFPLTRFDATPAYQLACVVDDRAMGIDCVIRGDDLLSSTPRQILVYRAMVVEEREIPRFAHVPLVVGADWKRLAKRHGESRIAQFRGAGVSPEKVVGWVAWRSGQIAEPREMGVGEVLAGFDVKKLPRERVVLGEADLGWLK